MLGVVFLEAQRESIFGAKVEKGVEYDGGEDERKLVIFLLLATAAVVKMPAIERELNYLNVVSVEGHEV